MREKGRAKKNEIKKTDDDDDEEKEDGAKNRAERRERRRTEISRRGSMIERAEKERAGKINGRKDRGEEEEEGTTTTSSSVRGKWSKGMTKRKGARMWVKAIWHTCVCV